MFAGQRLHESVIGASFRGMRGRERRCPCRSGEKRTTAGTASRDWRCAPGLKKPSFQLPSCLPRPYSISPFCCRQEKSPAFQKSDSSRRICLTWVTFSTRLLIMLTHPTQAESHKFRTSRPSTLSKSSTKNCLSIVALRLLSSSLLLCNLQASATLNLASRCSINSVDTTDR